GLGWSAYLTIWSRELNVDAQGNARVYVNDTTSLQTLYTNLTNAVGGDLAAYIIAYRMYGPAALPASGGNNSKGPMMGSGPPPRAVLLALPNLQSTDVASIINARPSPAAEGASDPIFQTPAWLITNANLKLATVKALEQYITTRSQVYKMQVVGYFDQGTGPF